MRRFEQWLDERESAAPFFAFLLLDAPHQSYWFPEDCTPFQPFADEVAYTSIDESAPEEMRTLLFNRCRNAVHYADRSTGLVLGALAARGLGADTLVVVTGDHGEAFCESDVWGHTSDGASSGEPGSSQGMLGPSPPLRKRPSSAMSSKSSALLVASSADSSCGTSSRVVARWRKRPALFRPKLSFASASRKQMRDPDAALDPRAVHPDPRQAGPLPRTGRARTGALARLADRISTPRARLAAPRNPRAVRAVARSRGGRVRAACVEVCRRG